MEIEEIDESMACNRFNCSFPLKISVQNDESLLKDQAERAKAKVKRGKVSLARWQSVTLHQHGKF